MSPSFEPIGSSPEVFVQNSEPDDTPQPPPDGNGGVWYETTDIDFGVEKWGADVGDRYGGTPMGLYDDKLLVSSEDNIYALDPNTGEQLWTQGFSYTIGDGIFVIHDGEWVIAVNEDEEIDVTDVLWIDPSDGSVNHREERSYRRGANFPLAYNESEAAATLYNSDNEESLLLDLNATSEHGGEIAEFDGSSSPAKGLTDEYALTEPGYLYNYDGDELTELDVPPRRVIDVDGDFIFAGGDGNDDTLYRYDPSTESGDTFEWELNEDVFFTGANVVNDGTLYAHSTGAYIYSIDIEDGSVNWREDIGNYAPALDDEHNATVEGGYFVTKAEDSNYFAFDISERELYAGDGNANGMENKEWSISEEYGLVYYQDSDDQVIGGFLPGEKEQPSVYVSDGSEWIETI